MNALLTKFRLWRRRWRRNRASKKQRAALREFVYLDEVSVYSLYASRVGPIAAEFTETETLSLQGESGGSLGLGLGVAKAEANSRAVGSQAHGSQVLRKSVVQTTFKELYEMEHDFLAMRPITKDSFAPCLRSFDEVERGLEELKGGGWIVDPAELTRGKLLEVEVQLEAEGIFRVSEVVSSLLDIFKESPQMLGSDLSQGISEVGYVNRILQKLLFGLVPIRGQFTDYRVVEIGDRELIAHNSLLETLPSSETFQTRPLFAVGVAERSLFWKDIRRVLFSKARFRALCRLTQEGLQNAWTPVKLVHVLESVAPDLAKQIDLAGTGALAAMVRAGDSSASNERMLRLRRDALVGFSELVATHYGKELDVRENSEVDLFARQHCTSFDTLSQRRKAFDAIKVFLERRFKLEIDREIVAKYREVALLDAGIGLNGKIISPVDPGSVPPSVPTNERFLDTEFVAIYW